MTSPNKVSVLKSLPEVFRFVSEPELGWMSVPYQLLVALDIHTKISPLSRRFLNTVFLNDGKDLSIFLKAYKRWFHLDSLRMKKEFFYNKLKIEIVEVSHIKHFLKFYID